MNKRTNATRKKAKSSIVKKKLPTRKKKVPKLTTILTLQKLMNNEARANAGAERTRLSARSDSSSDGGSVVRLLSQQMKTKEMNRFERGLAEDEPSNRSNSSNHSNRSNRSPNNHFTGRWTNPAMLVQAWDWRKQARPPRNAPALWRRGGKMEVELRQEAKRSFHKAQRQTI